jgi:hypothetical protein
LTGGDGTPDLDVPWFGWPEVLKDDGSRGATAADFAATCRRSVEIWEEYQGVWRPRRDGAAIEDDRGSRILTMLLCAAPRSDDPWSRRTWGESCAAGPTVGPGETVRRWGAIWRPPDDADPNASYLFKVTWSANGSDHQTCSVAILKRRLQRGCLRSTSAPDPRASAQGGTGR